MADPQYPTVWDGYLESGRPQRTTPIHQAPSVRNRAQTYPPGPNSCPDVDSYDLDDPGYNPHAWYTATCGSDKQAEQVNVRIPRYIANVLDELCARRTFAAVKVKADFIRSAIVHELYRRMAEMRCDDFKIEVSAHTYLEEAQKQIEEWEAKQGFLLLIRTQLENVQGDTYMTRRALDTLWGAIDSGQYTGPVLDELNDLNRKYGNQYLGPRLVDLT